MPLHIIFKNIWLYSKKLLHEFAGDNREYFETRLEYLTKRFKTDIKIIYNIYESRRLNFPLQGLSRDSGHGDINRIRIRLLNIISIGYYIAAIWWRQRRR